MVDIMTDIMTGIMTEPTRYALIIAFITSVIIFILNEWAKRRYLIHEKLFSLRLERFESLLEELYSYGGVYENIKAVSEIKIDNTSYETKYKMIAFNRFFKDIFSKSALNESEIIKAKDIQELKDKKYELRSFLLHEGAKNYNNIQIKASSLHLIMPDKTIQKKANKIAEDICNHVAKINEDKEDYSDKIRDDIKNLVDSMRTYLPSLSLIN